MTHRELAVLLERNWHDSHCVASAQRGWDSWKDAHRVTLPMAVACANARSVYELGCGAGPNLRLLHEVMPDLLLSGCDIRPEYIDWCNKRGFSVEPRALPTKVFPGWDATLSCYTLAYMDAESVLTQLNAIQSKALILMEPAGDGSLQYIERENGSTVIPRWYHDWGGLLGKTGWQCQWRWPIEPVDSLNTMVIAQRG